MGKEQQAAGELQGEMQVSSKGHELHVSGFLGWVKQRVWKPLGRQRRGQMIERQC